MDNNNQVPNTSPMMGNSPQSANNGQSGPAGSPPKTGAGPIIATVVIIAVIVLGGLYFWGKRIETEKENQAAMQSAGTTTDETAAANQATQIETVSQDDSLNTISSETQTTQTTNLSPELQ